MSCDLNMAEMVFRISQRVLNTKFLNFVGDQLSVALLGGSLNATRKNNKATRTTDPKTRQIFKRFFHSGILRWRTSPILYGCTASLTKGVSGQTMGFPAKFSSFSSLGLDKKLPETADSVFFVQKRFKKRDIKKAVDEDLEDHDTDTVVEEIKNDRDQVREWRDLKMTIFTPRIDAVLKAAFGKSRAKVDEAVLDSLIRVNGEKVHKKGLFVGVGDELDLIQGFNVTNPAFLDVSKVIIDEISPSSNPSKIAVRARCWKKIVVQNYDGSNKY